jgi:hypothetical protein
MGTHGIADYIAIVLCGCQACTEPGERPWRRRGMLAS